MTHLQLEDKASKQTSERTNEYSNIDFKMNQTRVASLTVGQRDNPEWWSQRKYRITCSNFGRAISLYHSRNEKAIANFVDEIIGKREPFCNTAMQYGIDMEGCARVEFKFRNPQYIYRSTGFWPCKQYPYLGGSPDGLIFLRDDANTQRRDIVEFKCPYTLRNACNLDEALKLGRQTPCYIGKHGINLSYNNRYSHQVQGLMAIMGATACEFVVFSPSGLYLQTRIEAMPKYAEHELKWISKFYCEYVQPRLPKSINFYGKLAGFISVCYGGSVVSQICKRVAHCCSRTGT